MLRRWKLSWATTLLLGLAVAALALSAGLYFLRLKAEATWEENRQQWEEAQSILARSQGTDLEALRNQLEQTRAEIERTTFPSPRKAAELSGLLIQWVESSQVQLKGLSFPRGVEKVGQNSYTAHYHQLTVTGNMARIQGFLRSFEEAKLGTLTVNRVIAAPKGEAWEAAIYAVLYTQQE